MAGGRSQLHCLNGKNESAATREGASQTSSGEFLEGGIDRVQMEAQRVGNRLLGRKLVARLEEARANGFLDLVGDSIGDMSADASEVGAWTR